MKPLGATALQDKECKATKVFGEVDTGVLASWPGAEFDLSQIYNETESAMKSGGFSLSNWLGTFTGGESPASASSSATATVKTSDVAAPEGSNGSDASIEAGL